MVYNILLTTIFKVTKPFLHINCYINRYYQINEFECAENDDFTDNQKYRTVIWIYYTMKSYISYVDTLNIFKVTKR